MEKSEISNNLLYTQKHFDLLINLNKHTLNYIYPINEILDLITESAVNGLDIDRASYWKIADEKLVCINLYDKNVNAHVIQDDLKARDFPVYFKALSEGIAIVANDAKTNNYTKEFKDSYLIPNGITDMLDLPIRENGKVIGVIPQVLVEWERQHTGISELFIVDDMHTRKKKMYDLCDAAIILPGGFGTLDELFEMVTWNQLSIHDKLIFILNSGGFYNHLIAHIGQMQEENFLYEAAMKRIIVITTPAELNGHL